MSNIEEQIRKAIREGKFDNLPGAGKPLNLGENPHEDPEWRLAHHMLRSNGFTLPWIETRQEIEKALDSHRKALERAWRWRGRVLASGQAGKFVEDRWEQALGKFREGIGEINKRIFSYNISTPSHRFHMETIDAAREIARITSAGPSSG